MRPPSSEEAGDLVRVLPQDHPCGRCAVRLQTFCGVLPAVALARFKAMGIVGRAARGECLFHEGDAADHVHNITAGTVKLYRLLPDGRRQIAAFARPGDFLGLVPEAEHLYTAEALETVEYCRFTRRRFDAFLGDQPLVTRALYRMARGQLVQAREQTLLLARKTAPERLASFLLAEPGSAAPGAIVRLPMSRADIADHLGLTKETVSRTFTLFRRARLLAPRKGGVELLQPDKLAQLAAGAAG